VLLGEELDAILVREQLIHYTAEMIATKAKGKNVQKKKMVEKMVKKFQKKRKMIATKAKGKN
jgi:hypothetical protein